MAKIDWEKYNDYGSFMIIDDIVGLCLQYNTDQRHPHGEFPFDTGGGFLYSVFITWRRADPNNKKKLMPLMKEWINQYDVPFKVKMMVPGAQEMSQKWLEKNGIQSWWS